MTYVSLTEFAELVGKNKSSITRAVKSGRIYSFEYRGNKLFIDDIKGAAEFKSNTREYRPAMGQGEPKPKKPKKPKPKKKEPKVSVAPMPPMAPVRDDYYSEKPSKTKAPDYADSRAICEAFKARLLKLDYEERHKKLVDAQEVKAQVAEAYRTVRNRLLAIPARISSDIVALDSHEAEKLITKEIDAALREVESWQPMR